MQKTETCGKTSKLPLIVDLDGTLTPTDTLAESVVQLAKKSPSTLVRSAIKLSKGKAAFKSFIASNSSISPETLPYREVLLDYLRSEKEEGRRLVLATASYKTVAEDISGHLGIFDDVIATDLTNLKGNYKLDAIRNTIGEDFVYAGDSSADLPIWESANAAVLVSASDTTSGAVRQMRPIEAEFLREPKQLRTWARALRIHQWLKNLLLFVPVATAFSFQDVNKLVDLAFAFFAFSLVASATYIFNDIWDLSNDRAHPQKKLRPIASAEISIISALAVSASCLIAGFATAWMLSTHFLTILALYLFVTCCYSCVLKQYVLIDVIVLALLYTLRIFAGAVVIEISTSTWLLAFSVFLFLSLALVKRCSELVSLEKSGGLVVRGRDYRVNDLTILWPLGIATSISAIVVFGLFINSPETVARYASPLVLWLVALGLVYWLSRLWIKTVRGEMHDDPVVYAIKDGGSRFVILLIAAAMVAAYYYEFGTTP